MRERFDVTRVELDDLDERITGSRRRTAAKLVQMEQRLAESEPGIGVGRVVDRNARVFILRRVHIALLPRDGRDIALEFCQSCHIITVVVTQDRTREAWLGTMNKPSHVEINTTQKEREALADYLSLNAAIPIEEVPETLRAGGATY